MFLKIHRKKCNGFQQKKLCKPTLLRSKLLLLSCELPLDLFLAWLDCSISILPADSVRGKQIEGLWCNTDRKHRINSHPIFHFPTSEGVSKVSKRVSAAERGSEASSAEQANEWAVRANERTDERMTQYCSLDSWLFWPTVCWRFQGWRVSKLIWASPCLTQVILRPTRVILRLLMNFSKSKPTRNSQSVGSSCTELLLYLGNSF